MHLGHTVGKPANVLCLHDMIVVFRPVHLTGQPPRYKNIGISYFSRGCEPHGGHTQTQKCESAALSLRFYQ
jgi:hypothetical protein